MPVAPAPEVWVHRTLAALGWEVEGVDSCWLDWHYELDEDRYSEVDLVGAAAGTIEVGALVDMIVEVGNWVIVEEVVHHSLVLELAVVQQASV